jgi:hypothetical protein
MIACNQETGGPYGHIIGKKNLPVKNLCLTGRPFFLHRIIN